MASSSRGKPLSGDWIFSISSNAHCCADREWFSEYTPFHSEATDYLSNELRVIGIGTIELSVKRAPNMVGKRSHAVLRLTDVLHVPDAAVNIVGRPIVEQYPDTTIDYDNTEIQGYIRDGGKQLAYMSLNGHNMLAFRLSGPPVGPRLAKSKLNPDADYVLVIFWPDRERQRWEAFRANKNSGETKSALEPSALVSSRPDLGPRNTPFEDYSSAKKKWLKDHHRAEYELLQEHGLNIFKDEYREQGQALLRAVLGTGCQQCGCKDGDYQDDGDDEFDGDYQDNLQLEGRDIEMFSDAELDFIEERFGSVSRFMAAHKLNPDNDEDRDKALFAVQVLMSKH
ncbi:hypothetical protein F5Y13DRAFT_192568 [Hypoxylon sp. FL1857]|nr:hypothetical protein F5Y13DRAFT_192568 [Hypoxylon sp. FL1857]